MKKVLRILTIILCVVLLCGMLAGCNKLVEWMDKTAGKDKENTSSGETTTVETLNTPVMSYKDGVIRWTTVTGADYYRVKYTNTETGEPHETLVRVPELNPETLELSAGAYLFVVRAECESDRYHNGEYVVDADGVTVTIVAEVNLDEVSFEALRIDNGHVLCTWTEVEGADVFHVSVANTLVDSTAQYAIVPVDATKDQTFVLTVTGRAGYPYEGKEKSCDYRALTASTVDKVAYDKKDEELSFSIYNPNKVEWDGVALLEISSGRLTLSGDMLREQSLGSHYMRVAETFSEKHVLVDITDTRPLVFVNEAGAVIDEIDYVLTRPFVVNMLCYANVVTAVGLDAEPVPAASYTLSASQLSIALAYFEAAEEGDHTVRVTYTDVEEATHFASLTVHVSKPTIPTYDVASGTALVLNGTPADTTGVLGAAITKSDYTLAASSVTLKAAYLATLHAGTYTYWLQGPHGAAFSLQVFNSTSAPYDVVLSYDDHATNAYGKWKCDCGEGEHYYSLDGGTRKALDTNVKDLGALSKTSQHTFTVYCNQNNTSASYTIKPTGNAATYFNAHYNFEGRNPDCYIGSIDEFVDVARFLSYGGNINYEKGEYGVSSLNVFVDANVIKTVDNNAVLNMLLNEANSRFTSPYSCSMQLEGTFDSTTHTCELTVSVTFNAAIPKPYVDDMEADEYEDARALLTANATPRTTYIEGVTLTENVSNVQELADLPLGVRPVFSGLDQATSLAKATYDAAVSVAQTYVRDSMTDIQKVQVFFDYLSRYVTYDYYTMVWYEISDRDRILEHNQYASFYNAAIATNQWNAFSEAERKDINACTNYRTSAKLVRRMAAEPGAKAFWGNWAATFDTFEADTMEDLRAFARQEVVNRNYTGTSLDTNVERMCAEDTFEGMMGVLFEMASSSAFDGYGALVGKVAVCDGISDAFRILCLVEGIECLKVSGIGKTENHAWNKVKIGDSWYVVDATWSKAAKCVIHRYFMVSDEVIASSHDERTGDVSRVETLALASGYNYYRDTIVHDVSLYTEDIDDFKSTFKTLYGAGETTIELYVASVPSEATLKKALSDAISELHILGGVTYTISYADGYVMVVF